MDLNLYDDDDQLIAKTRIRPETRKKQHPKPDTRASFLGKKSNKLVLEEISDRSSDEIIAENFGSKPKWDEITEVTESRNGKRAPITK